MTFRTAPPRAPALQATLRLPIERRPDLPVPLDFPALLKNTLEEDRQEQALSPPSPPPSLLEERRKIPAPSVRQMVAAQRKLSEYVFYPEQAKKLGLEGTVTLFVELSGDGHVEDVRIVESSGHPILDNAAVKGFYAVGRLPGGSDHWEYTFRLE